jgi:hypothetical protein
MKSALTRFDTTSVPRRLPAYADLRRECRESIVPSPRRNAGNNDSMGQPDARIANKAAFLLSAPLIRFALQYLNSFGILYPASLRDGKVERTPLEDTNFNILCKKQFGHNTQVHRELITAGPVLPLKSNLPTDKNKC